MFLPLLIGLVVAKDGLGAFARMVLPEPDGKDKVQIQIYQDRLPIPKLSPKQFGDDEDKNSWMFEWYTAGFGKVLPDLPQFNARFNIYSQQRKATGDPAISMSRQLMRMWQINFNRLKLDHSSRYNQNTIDVYVCWGGKAGGEQLFDLEKQTNAVPYKVNTMYFYDLPSFTEPVEMAREVAHEYGHATLPAIGGFKQPEDWANGYLGEKLYLGYLRDGMAAGRYVPDDAMGVTKEQLDTWIKTNVEPLALKAATMGPDLALLKQTSKEAMDSYIGLALYAATTFTDPVFARSIILTGSNDAKDYPQAIATAFEEPGTLTLKIPSYLKGKSIWIPLGKDAKLTGAVIDTKRDGWTKITPTQASVVVTNKQ